MTGLDIYHLHLVFNDVYVKFRLYCYGNLCLIAASLSSRCIYTVLTNSVIIVQNIWFIFQKPVFELILDIEIFSVTHVWMCFTHRNNTHSCYIKHYIFIQ